MASSNPTPDGIGTSMVQPHASEETITLGETRQQAPPTPTGTSAGGGMDTGASSETQDVSNHQAAKAVSMSSDTTEQARTDNRQDNEAPSGTQPTRKANPEDVMRKISAAAAGHTRRTPGPRQQRDSTLQTPPDPVVITNGSDTMQQAHIPVNSTSTPAVTATAWSRPLPGTTNLATRVRLDALEGQREAVREKVQEHKQQFADNYACATKESNLILGENQRAMTALELKTLELYQNREIHLDETPQFVYATMTEKEVNRLKDYHREHIGFYLYGPVPPGLDIPNGGGARKQLYMSLYRAAGSDEERKLLDTIFDDCVYWDCSRRTRTIKMRFKWPQVRDLWRDCEFRFSKSTRTIKLTATDSLNSTRGIGQIRSQLVLLNRAHGPC